MTSALPENPFPGMNPYLERADLWPSVHNRIIVGLSENLARRLRPNYIVSIEQRVYITEEPGSNGQQQRIPDLLVLGDVGAVPHAERLVAEPVQREGAIAVQLPAIELERERYLKVIRVDTREVIAVIELLSPTNKSGDGRKEYLAKRGEIKYSPAHLVEIDLLRAGPPMPVVGDVPHNYYRILVANARLGPEAHLYAFGLRNRIPEFVMPLVEGAEGIAVNLTPVVNDVYTGGAYDLRIDYQQDPEPPLSCADQKWLDRFLRQQGLRSTAN